MTPEEKLDSILSGITDIKVEMAKIQVKYDQQQKEIDKLTTSNNELVADKNKVIGIAWFGSALIGFGAWIISKIWH